MKHKYITLQIMLACLPGPEIRKKDIHAQIQETILERKRILRQLERISQTARVIDMYLDSQQTA